MATLKFDLSNKFKFPQNQDELTEFILDSDKPMMEVAHRGRAVSWISRRWDIMERHCTVCYPCPSGLVVSCPDWFDRNSTTIIPMPSQLREKYGK